jgi:hypothetical protein
MPPRAAWGSHHRAQSREHCSLRQPGQGRSRVDSPDADRYEGDRSSEVAGVADVAGGTAGTPESSKERPGLEPAAQPPGGNGAHRYRRRHQTERTDPEAP